MSTENNTAAAVVTTPTTFPDCPSWGMGGSYLYDPATGKRTLVLPSHSDDQPKPEGSGPSWASGATDVPADAYTPAAPAAQDNAQATDQAPSDAQSDAQETSAPTVKEKKRA